ncbi:MAG: hypothetical protein POH28_08275 [Acidocella sp.]|nr:hypothetical protein [Acidocella sp.]
MLAHLVAQATQQDFKQMSLETGRGPAFEPALALYRGNGFRDGGPCADYAASAFSQFLRLDL